MDNNLKYKSVDYWNERYQEEESFEWFGEYAIFKSVLNKTISHSDKILILGCGNSKMSRDMYEDQYKNIVNTDYSEVIIDLMSKRNSNCEGMTWEVMDINDLNYEQSSFECVLEKGTLDALLVDEKDPWNLSKENEDKLDKILERISSILKENGVFISITFAQPHFRKPIYSKDKYKWSIEQFTIGETFHYFVYIMRKGHALNENDKYFYCRQNLNKKNANKLYLDGKINENYLFQIELDNNE